MSRKSKIGLIIIAILIIAIFILYSIISKNRKKDLQLSAVPSNAAAVLVVDIPSLVDKADLVSLITETGYKSNKLLSGIFDAASSGIDHSEKMYGFMVEETQSTFFGMAIRLSDAKKFVSWLRDGGIKATADDRGDYDFIAAGMNWGIGYTKDVAVILYSKDENIQDYAGKYLAQEASQSISSNKDFVAFNNKKPDIGVFTQNKDLAGMQDMGSSLAMVGLNKGHGELICSFENDMIKTTYENYPTADLFSLLVAPTSLSAQDRRTFTPKMPLIYASAHVNMDGLFNLLQNDSSTASSLRETEGMMGTEFGKVKKFFNGKISFAITDYKDISANDPRVKALIASQFTQSTMAVDAFAPGIIGPMTYINVGITDKMKMNNFLSGLGLQKNGSFFQAPGLDLLLYAGCSDSTLMISNDYFAVDSLTKGIGNTAVFPSSIKEDPSAYPLFGWANMNLDDYPKDLTDTSGYVYKDNGLGKIFSYVAPFDHATFRSTATNAEFDLFIKPGDGNSLNRLLLYYANLE